MNQAFVVQLLRETDKTKRNTTNGQKSSANSESVFLDSWFVRCTEHEQMVPSCVVPTYKRGGRGVMVWGCFSEDAVGEFFRINQHGYHNIHSHLVALSGTIICFSTGQ